MKEYQRNGKLFGRLGDDLIFRKRVDSQKHRLKIFDAYGIEETVVQDLLKQNCKEIRIKEENTGTVLSVLMQDFMEHSKVMSFQTKQRFLSIKFFNYGKRKED